MVRIDLITSSYGLLFRSIGKPDYEMKITMIIACLIYFPAVIVGVYINGIIGVAYGILITKIISFIIIKYILSKNFKISLINLWDNIKPAAISLIVTFLIIYPIFKYLGLQILMSIILMFIIFICIIGIFLREEIKIFINSLDNQFKTK